MRKLLVAATAAAFCAAPALAADMPTKAAPAPAVWNWSGFYAGIGVGWSHNGFKDSWGITDNFLQAGSSADPHSDGVAGSITIGAQQQYNNMIVGLEASYLGFANKAAQRLFATQPPCTFAGPNGGAPCGVEDYAHGTFTITPRLGLAMDRTLWYIKGGYAETKVNEREVNCCTNAAALANPFVTPWDDSQSNSWHGGWVLGGGVQWAWTNHIILGIDYQHIEISSKTANTVLNCHNAACAFSPPLFGQVRVGGNLDVVQATLTFKN